MPDFICDENYIPRAILVNGQSYTPADVTALVGERDRAKAEQALLKALEAANVR